MKEEKGADREFLFLKAHDSEPCASENIPPMRWFCECGSQIGGSLERPTVQVEYTLNKLP